MEFFPPPDQTQVFFELTLAMILGLLLGAERSIAGKSAGMRTYALVAMGSCLFVLISVFVSSNNFNNFNFDPLRVAAGIVTGVGFLGAGLIVLQKSHLHGLTTAAGLWVASAVGVAVGFGLHIIAIFTTFLTLVVFTIMWFVEVKVKTFSPTNQPENKPEQDHS